eukprot:8366073-Prorocentrum_lima.AAC.1
MQSCISVCVEMLQHLARVIERSTHPGRQEHVPALRCGGDHMHKPLCFTAHIVPSGLDIIK